MQNRAEAYPPVSKGPAAPGRTNAEWPLENAALCRGGGKASRRTFSAPLG